MPHWYSPRGARRGLLLAGITAALWLGWALGYTQGAAAASAPPSSTSTTKSAPVPCCLQQPRT